MKIDIGIPLDHGQAPGNTLIDLLTRHFHATAIGAAFFGQQLQQGTIATPDIEHAGTRSDHFSDQLMVDARLVAGIGIECGCGFIHNQ